MRAVVTGASGFIGSNLVDRLLKDGHTVVGVDNFSTGRREFLTEASKNSRFSLLERDLLDERALDEALDSGADAVFHFAANADVREGLKYPRRDLEQNTIVTWNVLDSMRRHGVKKIGFSSTGSIYGDAKVIPTPEDCPFPIQTSLYGASKLAAEGLLAAFAEGYGMQATIYRFVSILGERYTHGHVFDFVRHLSANPKTLPILGDGTQRKSYLYVGDCVEAMIRLAGRSDARPVEVFNLGTDEYVTVNDSIDVICDELGVSPERVYSGGNRGWVGDNPFIFLSCEKLKNTGWSATRSIRDGVRATVRYLNQNPWVFEARK